jgi:hypothetical protein
MHICYFPGSRPIVAPKDWLSDLDGECGEIYVTDATDILTGMNVMYSVYKLTEEEIQALRDGGVLRLGILGTSHPVFNLGVLSSEVISEIDLKPIGDLGGVIHKS